MHRDRLRCHLLYVCAIYSKINLALNYRHRKFLLIYAKRTLGFIYNNTKYTIICARLCSKDCEKMTDFFNFCFKLIFSLLYCLKEKNNNWNVQRKNVVLSFNRFFASRKVRFCFIFYY